MKPGSELDGKASYAARNENGTRLGPRDALFPLPASLACDSINWESITERARLRSATIEEQKGQEFGPGKYGRIPSFSVASGRNTGAIPSHDTFLKRLTARSIRSATATKCEPHKNSNGCLPFAARIPPAPGQVDEEYILIRRVQSALASHYARRLKSLERANGPPEPLPCAPKSVVIKHSPSATRLSIAAPILLGAASPDAHYALDV